MHVVHVVRCQMKQVTWPHRFRAMKTKNISLSSICDPVRAQQEQVLSKNTHVFSSTLFVCHCMSPLWETIFHRIEPTNCITEIIELCRIAHVTLKRLRRPSDNIIKTYEMMQRCNYNHTIYIYNVIQCFLGFMHLTSHKSFSYEILRSRCS